MTWYPLDLPSKQGTFIKSRRLDSNNSPKKAHIWGHPAQAWSGIDISKHLRITFIGEPAVDGGPMREYMLLLQYRCFVVMFILASCDTMLLRSIRRRTSMLVRYRLFHLFMVDQLLYFLLSQLPTTSCMDWRLKFTLQINKTRQSRGNYKKWVI